MIIIISNILLYLYIFFKGFSRVVVGASFSVIPYRVNLFKSLYITPSAVGRLRGLHAMESHVYTLYIYILDLNLGP